LSLTAFLLACCCAASLFGTSALAAACPNEAFRGGASAALPDCRAYELVTPPDAVGRFFYTIKAELPYNFFPTELATPSGESMLFMTQGEPLPGSLPVNGTNDVYEARRTSTGWSAVRVLTPSGEEATFPNPGGVSSDHAYTFIEAHPVPEEFSGTLAEEGDASYLGNPDGSFELLGIGSLGTELVAQGRFISPGGEHVIFTTGDGEWCFGPCPINQLEPAAPPTGTATVYDRSADGPTRVVSLLPGNLTPAAGENAEYQGTSTDGTLVAFKVGGTMYVRIDNAETKEVTSEPSTFAGVLGGRVFYVSSGDIYSFNTASGQTEQVNTTEDAEVVNISPDGSHVFFISPTALPETAAQPAQPNLYVWEEEGQQTDFVATVSPADLEGRPALNTWTTRAVTPEKFAGQGPGADSSRVTPGGSVLVFESRAQLTSYENQEHIEIYRYASGSGDLTCVSCNPGGQPASANARLEALESFNIQAGGESMVLHNLSADGRRVFFETVEPLVERDLDGVNDIYEWQAGAEGEAPSLSLISSGQSVFYTNPTVPLEFQEPNVMFAITPSGNDVLFRTTDRLVQAAEAGGSTALYDARVGGGFAGAEGAACRNQICEGSGSAPALNSPASNQFHGKGNVKRHAACRHRRHGNRAGKHRKGKHRSCRHRHRHRKGSGR
jgi:hypothetical protein